MYDFDEKLMGRYDVLIIIKVHIYILCIYVIVSNMEASKKRTPIVFNLQNNTDMDYHLVDRNELNNMDTETMRKRIDELNMRVQFARKHYKGRYDNGHKKWMETLVKPMKSHHKVNLSLDALVAVSKDYEMVSKRR